MRLWRADGKNPQFTLKSPFQELLSISEHPILLRAASELRTIILNGYKSYEMEAAAKVIRGEEPFDEKTMKWMEEVHPQTARS